jgi:bifunctional pyridoxal-dependent enzyme with beta-cystathionase and maltose regulon repressor activities
MRKQLNIMEAALLEEDRVFQSTISTLQENLLANKVRLIVACSEHNISYHFQQ